MNSLKRQKTNKLAAVAPRQSLEDLILPSALVETFFRLKRERDRKAELARNGLKPRNRLLFYGPPGNGKTASSEALANLLGLDFYVANYAQLIDSLHGGSEKAITEAFDAIANTACLVLFDEADSILSSRISAQCSADRANNNSTNLLLTRLDQLSPHVVFVAATNRVEDLDRAAARRFDLAVEFANPSLDQKIEFCQQIIGRFPVLKGKQKPEEIVNNSAADSFAELEKEVIDLARQEIVGK